jgi:MerR family transcriptional regulator, light-induced transcriptional regulator
MTLNEKKYNIQQVSDVTGVSKQLIRKWEDRYHLVSPQRLDNGYRMYTQYEVNLIKSVTKLIEQGNTVKQAVEIVQLPTFEMSNFLSEEPTTSTITHEFLDKLELAGSLADDKKILHLLQQAHHTLGVEKLITFIVVPYLKKIGELWCDQTWGEYQEAIASQTVRDFLANLRREMYVPESAPVIVGSCLPGEYHEIPMHILLVQCALKGYRTIMLGQSPAPKAIESIVTLKKPKYVLLTASTLKPFEDTYQFVRLLDDFAASKPHIPFYLGGAGAISKKEEMALTSIQVMNVTDEIPSLVL